MCALIHGSETVVAVDVRVIASWISIAMIRGVMQISMNALAAPSGKLKLLTHRYEARLRWRKNATKPCINIVLILRSRTKRRGLTAQSSLQAI